MRSLALLENIRSAYSASFEGLSKHHEKITRTHRDTKNQVDAGVSREAAHHRLAECLRLLCTDICILGEEYVRTFPTKLYVLALTDILAAAHEFQSKGWAANPLSLKESDGSARCPPKVANHTPPEIASKGQSRELPPRRVSYSNVQVASVIEVLALRALALIADIVPRGSFMFCSRQSKETIPTLALYLANQRFLLANEDLLEELLKCFLYVSRVAHEACVDACVPQHTVALLLLLAPHHLRLLCVQVVSSLLACARESDLEGVWSPVMTKLMSSLDCFLLDGSLHAGAAGTAGTAHHAPLIDFSLLATSPSAHVTPTVNTAAPTTAYPALSSARSFTPSEQTLLEHYMEAVAHATDRLFVSVVSMEAHMKVLDHIIQLCVQLLYLSIHVTPVTCGEWLRTVALSPILAFYLNNPTFALPVMLRLRVWEAVCGCMLALVEHREKSSKAPGTAVDDGAAGGETAGGTTADNASISGDASSSIALSAMPTRIGSSSGVQRGTSGGGSFNAVAGGTRLGAAPQAGPSFTTGPVLTTDVTTIPFIADELRLLPLLEFLLVLLPCARRGHSHADFRHTALPHFGWAWEDDFHNKTECDEALSRRFECIYQHTRSHRTHELFAVTHAKQAVFYTDFLRKCYLSERQEHHCLHRKPLLTGYVHSTQNALLRGCTCCTSQPAPRFSTWMTHSSMRLRTAHVDITNRSRVSDGEDTTATEDNEGGGNIVPAPESTLLETTLTQTTPLQPVRANVDLEEVAGRASPSSLENGGRRISLLQLPGALVNDSDTDAVGANRNPSRSRSPSRHSIGGSPSRESSGGTVYVNQSPRSPRTVHSDRDQDCTTDGEYYRSARRSRSRSLSRNSRRRCGLLDVLLCRCNSGTTAKSHHRIPRMQMGGFTLYSPLYSPRRGHSLALTVLPMEAMLEDPGERLQSDPATRKAFLGKGVLSSILSTIVPALVSVLDNCVNPVVARHSVTVLLRCFSLSADLRTQVTGEPIELTTKGISKEMSAGVTPSPQVREGGVARGRMSFRKWINKKANGNPKRWKRAEWEATQAALRRFVPSLREVLVSLYVAGGAQIMAERQDVFGYLRDDVLMADELARVGLSPQFSGFQLGLPSEQHICTADTIGLLLRLLGSPGSMAGATPISSQRIHNKGKTLNSPLKSQRHTMGGSKDTGTSKSQCQPVSFDEAKTQGSVASEPKRLAEWAATRSQSFQDGLFSVDSLAPRDTSSCTHQARLSQGGREYTIQRRMIPPPLSPTQPSGNTDDHMIASISLGAGNQLPHQNSPTTPSRVCGGTFSQAGAKGHRRRSAAAHEFISKASSAVAASGCDGSDGELFTLHQEALLVSYASQIVRRSVMVCASAQKIHKSMNKKVFCKRVVFGADGGDDGSRRPIRSRDLTLRLLPDDNCAYHSTFPACTEIFFRASEALLVALVAPGISQPSSPRISTRVSKETLTQPVQVVFPSALAPSVQLTEVPRLRAESLGQQSPAIHFTALGDELARIATPSRSESLLNSNLEGEIPVDVTLPGIPTTVNAAEMEGAIHSAMEDTTGVYRRLPPALRGLLGFFDYCKRFHVELRAAVAETPEVLGEIAARLEDWLAVRARRREGVECSDLTSTPASFTSNSLFNSSSSHRMNSVAPSDPQLHFDSITRGKLLCLTTDFATTIGRDLGLATLDVAPSVVVKQPYSFQKRTKRRKTFGCVRYLVWRPLKIVLSPKIPALTNEVCQQAVTGGASSSISSGDFILGETPVVVVRRTALPILTGIKLSSPVMSVLPTTTLSSLAEAVAAQIQLLPRIAVSRGTRHNASKQGSPVQPMGATQGLGIPSRPVSLTLGITSSSHRGRNSLEGHRAESTGPTVTTEMSVSADRILFFLDGTPLLSPMTTLLDALFAFSSSGASLRDFVRVQRGSVDSSDTHKAKMTALLPMLPFWTLDHELEFVVLSEPLPASLIFDLAGEASSSSMKESCGCCGCDGLRPALFCSPKHLFDEAPANGPLALYSALSRLIREEVRCSLTALESSQRRLSSAVVHELYHQLNIFMLPPLLWCSGIGGSSSQEQDGSVGNTGTTLSSGDFPLPSYVLWRYPFIFSMEMRLSIFKFFISAQRALSHEQAKRLLQNYRHLLVPAAPNVQAQATPSNTAEEPQRILNIVGLQWLSGEVARRRRVTLVVHRNNILQSAEELIKLATCNVAIDVAFEDEAGIGNGPAMEFYEMVAEALLNPRQGLWRTEPIPLDEAVSSQFLTVTQPPVIEAERSPRTAAFGASPRRRPCLPLFPAAKQTATSLHYWRLLGVLLGRLLVLDTSTSLSFHPLLLRRLRGESLMSTEGEASRNMLEVDAALELTLQRLEVMSPEGLAACDLFFTIPLSEADGYVPGAVSEPPLMPGGADRQVTVDNVREYTHCLRRFYLHTVPDQALLHLRQGLQYTVNPLYLQLFNVDELGRLLGSPQDSKVWETREHFARNVEAAHGYNMRSNVVQYLLDIVPTWDAKMQRAFLKFVTGSSAFPYGGLTQRIKVVRRDADASVTDLTITSTAHSFGASTGALATSSSFMTGFPNHDSSLPTVSTCFLYLKLPNYSSKAVLQDRLRFAVCEGQGFFSLT